MYLKSPSFSFERRCLAAASFFFRAAWARASSGRSEFDPSQFAEQSGVIPSRLFDLVCQFRRAPSAVEPVEAVRIGLHGSLVFRERLFGTVEFQQHIGKHFTRRHLYLAFATRILAVGGCAH